MYELELGDLNKLENIVDAVENEGLTKDNSIVVTQRVFIDDIQNPTTDWNAFSKVFDVLQKECISASMKSITFCNNYASNQLSFGKKAADKWVEDNYNVEKKSKALYDLCRNESKYCYSGTIGSIGRDINKRYFSGDHSYLKQIKSGEGNPPMTYTTSLPIPMIVERFSFVERSENKNSRYYDFNFPLLSEEGKDWFKKEFKVEKLTSGCFKFSTFAKSDYTYEILENIVLGNYKLCGSKLKRVETKKKSKNKNGEHRRYEYILLLSYRKPKVEHVEASMDRVLGVDLGIKVPACCGVNFNDYYRKSLGSDKIIRENIKQEKINRKLQQDITYNCRDGHGRTTKLDGWDGKGHKIANRNDYYNHMLAKKIVENAVKWNCGEIHIEDLTKIKNYTNNKFLKHWTYFDLQQKITYKAEAQGIVVKKINPYHTSQICSFCGHFEPGQRLTQSQFICKNPECKNYQKPINADFNASRNIAKSTDFTEPKWKNQKKNEDNA